MLVIQVVELVWTKASRGSAGGEWRAGVQRALPVDLQPGDGACVVQRYQLHAGDGFLPTLRSRESFPHVPGKEGALRIRSQADDQFLLGLAGNLDKRPPPGWPDIPTALVLMPGQFMRFIVNERQTLSRGNQRYVERAYNVTTGIEVPADRFTQGPPDRELDLRGHLF